MTPGEIQAIRSVTAIHQPRKAINVAEAAFRNDLNTRHIPRASALLDLVHDAAKAAALAEDWIGFKVLAELYFKTCGLIRPPTNEAKIAEEAKALLDAMIAEARQRRQGP